VTWVKRGRLLDGGPTAWSVSHAAIPVALPIANDLVRVYFSGRDAEGRARIGFADFDPARWGNPLRVSPAPSLGLGDLGGFDDRGVTSSWSVAIGSRLYHYYTGWSLGVTVPFYLAVGLAVSDASGETWQRVSPAPLFDRSTADPLLTASPCVLHDGGVWRMWYVSAARWEPTPSGPRHHYHIRYAESDDGLTWRREGRIAIDFENAGDYAIARPCVVKDADGYRMWYSHRGGAYRLGYATSRDGLTWVRQDDRAGIVPEATGWESEMIAYAHVFDIAGRRYMLYNGNGYGRTGFGLAEWQRG
jgi:hypothetical protein